MSAHDHPVPTSAVSRDISHLDAPKWFGMLAISAYVRYVIAHPFKVVMARKRTSREEVSTRDVVRQVVRQHGCRGLFRGCAISAGGNSVGEACYVYFFEVWRVTMPFQSQMKRDAAAGLAADLWNVVIAAPFDMIAARQMTAGSGICHAIPYRNSLRMAQSVWKEQGPRGMCAGTSASLLGSPMSAVWWAMYDPIKKILYGLAQPWLSAGKQYTWLPAAVTSHDDNFILNSSAGTLASVVATVLYNPLLVVAIRLQCSMGTDMIPMNYGRSKILYLVKDVWRNEGLHGFFKGMSVNMSLAAVEGILFAQMYEMTKYYCDTTR